VRYHDWKKHRHSVHRRVRDQPHHQKLSKRLRDGAKEFAKLAEVEIMGIVLGPGTPASPPTSGRGSGLTVASWRRECGQNGGDDERHCRAKKRESHVGCGQSPGQEKTEHLTRADDALQVCDSSVPEAFVDTLDDQQRWRQWSPL
jgi:hypothetical protein